MTLHAASQDGSTPLKKAADAGNEGLLRLLIEHKAEIDAASQVPSARIFAFASLRSGAKVSYCFYSEVRVYSIVRMLACAQPQGARRPTPTQSTCLEYCHGNEASKCGSPNN